MDPPPRAELDRVLHEQEGLYPHTECSKYVAGDIVMDVPRSVMMELMMETNWKSSPGVPLAFDYPTKGNLLTEGASLLCELVLDRLSLLANTKPEVLASMSAERKVLGGYTDPIRIFIKDEAIKVSKGAASRLIFSVSAIDEVIDRLLFKAQHRAELAMWDQIPSANGIGFTDEMNKKMYDSIKDVLHEACDSDVSGWDWCLNEWLLNHKRDLMKLLIESPSGAVFRTLVDNRHECLNDSVIAASDGRLFVLEHKGIQKSGALDTGSGNSKMRDATARLAGAKWSKSNGDDNVCQYVEGLREKWESMGLRVKHINMSDGKKFNFCSQDYEDGVAKPTNAKKALLRLLNGPFDAMKLWQYENVDFRNAPDLRECLDLISESGWAQIK